MASVCKKGFVSKVNEFHIFKLCLVILLCVVTMMSWGLYLQGRSRCVYARVDGSCARRTRQQVSLRKLIREKMRRKNGFPFLFGLFAWAAVDFLRQKYCEIENSNAPCYPHLVFAACLVHMLLNNITRTNAQSISTKNSTKLHLF